MYRLRTPGYNKLDLAKRWSLPDRVFFACGACHILAEAFLERYGERDRRLIWFKPAQGFSGNHIVVLSGSRVFDYHGHADWDAFIAHTFKRARQHWPGWDAALVDIPRVVLTSNAKSKLIDGLWLREPSQFLHNALPRARDYLNRFPGPEN
jgi:hypothetical protein